MPSLRDIRRRIRSVRNTAKITKAMELVAASRLRRAQMRVVSSRPYADAMRELISELATQGHSSDMPHPLLLERTTGEISVIVISPDRGLAGPLNANIVRRATDQINQQEREGKRVRLITLGRKGQDFFVRRGRTLQGTFTGVVDRPHYDHVIPAARLIIDDYTAGVIDHAYLVYPRFISTLVQRPEVHQLLPISPPSQAQNGEARARPLDYIYEPSPDVILEALLPRYIEVQLYQALLETSASFSSAQMVAMRNASDNAKDLVDDLNLTYNKVRQAGITREVTEIASAAEAMAASAH